MNILRYRLKPAIDKIAESPNFLADLWNKLDFQTINIFKVFKKVIYISPKELKLMDKKSLM